MGICPMAWPPRSPRTRCAATGTRSPKESRLWQLRSAEANLLEDERLRLDRWWRELPDEARSALVMSRGRSVPRAWRAAVLDLHSDGLTPGTDLEAEFRMSGIAAAYIEMVATCCR
ncbi:hypothetical protein [Mycolicibacterium goodii]|uniref:hypothetical protein n=1 Tax=Mycolicibacterium goodii TaxID=134601 RepID=UPI00257D6D0C|nr:hypothetical protein [Mycolicibacterium goodii]